MWKPWILIALGSVLIANVATKGYAPADSISAYNSNLEARNFDLSSSKCADEIEKACGNKVSQEEPEQDEVIINDQGTYSGNGPQRTDLINSMKQAVDSLSTALPPNFNKFIKKAVANVD
jgi:hypothetical protein